jgi:hypothetical protein
LVEPAVSSKTATGELYAYAYAAGVAHSKPHKYRQKRRTLMATKQKQKQKQNTSKKRKIDESKRRVQVYLLKDMDVVEFKVWLARDGEQEDEHTFGGGALKREDLHRVAQALMKYDRYLEICDADQKGYRRAMQERNEDQNHDVDVNNDNGNNGDNNNNDEQNDDQNDNDDNDNENQEEPSDFLNRIRREHCV